MTFTDLYAHYEQQIRQQCVAIISSNIVISYDELCSPNTNESKYALEAALRNVCCQYVGITTINNCDQLYVLIELVLNLAERDFIDSSLPFYVIEDALEQLDIERCETLFTRLQILSPRLTAESLLLKKNNRLYLLRLCNSLLKRLSKTVKTKFCGAVLAMVSSFNTVDERGGLNITGKSNVDNRTVIETVDQMNEQSHDHANDSVMQQFRVDNDFYQQVWSIQQYFTDCQSLIIKQSGSTSANQPLIDQNKLNDFETKLSSIINAFHHSPIAIESNMSSNVDQSKTDHSQIDSAVIPSSFFPKYLSGSRLLNLQLQDPTFRRHVLTQSLIFMQFLLTNQTGETVKKALASSPLPSSSVSQIATAKSTVVTKPSSGDNTNQSSNLTVDKLNHLIRSVVTELQTTSASVRYSTCLVDILHAEGAWINWKKEKAPAISREPVSLTDAIKLPVDVTVKRVKKRKLATFSMMDDSEEANLKYEGRFNMGSEACAQLFAVESNIESISNNNRCFLPSLDTLVDPLIDEELDRRERLAKKEEVEDESELQRSNKVLCWRILRAARRADPALFLKSEGSVLDIIKAKIDQREKQQSEQPVDVPVVVEPLVAPISVNNNNDVVEIADLEADPEDSKLDEPANELLTTAPSIEEDDEHVKVDENDDHDDEDSGHRRNSRKETNDLLERSDVIMEPPPETDKEEKDNSVSSSEIDSQSTDVSKEPEVSVEPPTVAVTTSDSASVVSVNHNESETTPMETESLSTSNTVT